MSCAEVQSYLHEHIPLTAAMQVGVLACDDVGVTLSAPLAPNINHRETGFGGSISALGITAGWTWLHVALRKHLPQPVRIVIQRNDIQYLAPARGAMEARCEGPSGEAFPRLLETLQRYRKARLTLRARVTSEGVVIATFAGTYVVSELSGD